MFNDGDGFEDAMRRMERSMDAAGEHKRKCAAALEKQSLDPPRAAEVGERVLVNSGLVGRGHLWERREGIVIEVADTAYQVRWKEIDSGIFAHLQEAWVHRFAVTDVLGFPKEPTHAQ